MQRARPSCRSTALRRPLGISSAMQCPSSSEDLRSARQDPHRNSILGSVSEARPSETRTTHVREPREMSCRAFRAIKHLLPGIGHTGRTTSTVEIKIYWGFKRVLLIKSLSGQSYSSLISRTLLREGRNTARGPTSSLPKPIRVRLRFGG
jgi:hypothetical protein